MAIVRPFILFTPSAFPARPIGVGLCALVVPAAADRPLRAVRSLAAVDSAPLVRSAAAASPARRRRRRAGTQPGPSLSTPLCVALLLLIVAVVVAPEQPHDQEAICHRHSGEVACRVW